MGPEPFQTHASAIQSSHRAVLLLAIVHLPDGDIVTPTANLTLWA
jgi:hypothetical protein